tara:strand:+ start:7187 stop:8509 length:1323 start_codon:yes stop_codon:yes gene_type:complete
MSKQKKNNLNIIIGSVLLLLVTVLNPYTWINFFDADGFLLFSRLIILITLDIVCVLLAYYFFKHRNNKLAYKLISQILIFNMALLLFCLFLLQLLFGDWLYNNPWLNKSVVISDVSLLTKLNNLYDSDSDYINYSRDQYGLRGKYDSVDNIDIITIGGSTTDQRYIADSLTFQRVLQKEFLNSGRNISIANAGIDGQSTIGHINNFYWWFPYIKNLRADYFLFFIGINDYHVLNSKIKRTPQSDLVNIKTGYSKMDKFQYYFSKNIIYQLIGLLDAFYYSKKEGLTHGAHKPVTISNKNIEKGKIFDYDTMMKQDLIDYKDRLFKLDYEVKKLGGKTIFVSQSRKIYKIKNKQIIGVPNFGKYKDIEVNGVDYFHIMQLMHNSVKEVAQQTNAIFLDLDSELIFDYDKDFYDDMHTTPLGSEKIGKYLYEKLKHLNFSSN